jgi:hypothetical protein
MNVFAQFFGVALNLLMTPFDPSAPAMPYIVSETRAPLTSSGWVSFSSSACVAELFYLTIIINH